MQFMDSSLYGGVMLVLSLYGLFIAQRMKDDNRMLVFTLLGCVLTVFWGARFLLSLPL